jgi:AhpD family alkylhydroperoxidase
MTRITMQEAEGVYAILLKGEEYLKQTSLDHKLISLLKFRVSQINSCAYCLDMHFKEALAEGESEVRLYSLSAWKEAPYYSEKERAVLKFAEDLTFISHAEFSHSNYEVLTNFFTKKEIADLTLAVTQINSWNRLVRVFNPEPGKYKVKKELVK